MLLLDTSFLIAYENELAQRQPGAASAVLGAHRHEPVAVSIIAAGEFAEGFDDPQEFADFIQRFRVMQMSRAIAWRMATLQTSLPQRLGESDAWIAATALAHDATLVGRDAAFARVPRLRYQAF